MEVVETAKDVLQKAKDNGTSDEVIFGVIDPVSEDLRQILQVVMYVFMCGTVSLVGIVTNVVNIIVFVRQGFQDSMNISLLGLSVADLLSVTTMFAISLSFNPLLDHSGISINLFDVLYLTVGWPHVFFNRVSSFITVFISMERCLCVTLPLTVKAIITPLRTKVVIISIYGAIFILLSPLYFVNKLDWCYSQFWNRTMLALVHTEKRVEVETTTFSIHSIAMPVISLATVIVCTTILVVQLNKKTKWRETSAHQMDSRKSGLMLAKEKKVAKMVIFLSAIFIICYLPSTINFFIMAYNPEFSISGKYSNLYLVIWSLTVFVETLNSSVNVFVYFRMSTKFRNTFTQMFCKLLNS